MITMITFERYSNTPLTLQAGWADLFKIPGENNVSDILSKHVAVADIEKHMKSMNMMFEDGRHSEAPSSACSIVDST